MNWTICYDGADAGGGGAGAGAAAPGAGGAAAPTAPVAPWYTGKADAEIVGHWQNLGLHDKSPEEVAIAMTRSHREAQKYVGAPAHQLVRLPAQEGDAEGWKQVFRKIGAPADSSGYDFNGIAHVDGKALDTNVDQAIRAAAIDGNLTKAQAASVARGIVKMLDSQRSTEMAVASQKLTEEKAALDKNWGLNKSMNLLTAQSGARALGISPEAVKALENVVGYSQVMEMFRVVGSKMGEDQFIENKGPGGNGVMTREQAIAKKEELMKDTVWRESYLKGDRDKARELTNLISIINSA